MIRNLPEGSRYVAVRASDVDEMPTDIEMSAEEQRRIDAQIWNFDRKLQAMIVNAVNTNTALTGKWKKGKTPEFPIAGPIEWDEKRLRQLKAKEKVDKNDWNNWDVARALGLMNT